MPLTFTVQELIDHLSAVEDKTQPALPPVAEEPPPPLPALPNVSDIINWREQRGLLAAVWHSTGHNLNWQTDQIKAGRRLLPTWPMNGYDWCLLPKSLSKMDEEDVTNNGLAPAFRVINDYKLPLCVRTGNIGDFGASDRFDLPLTEASFPQSPRVWMHINGLLEDKGRPCMFGPAEIWRKEGELIAESPVFKRLVEKLPNLPWWQYLENNESNETIPHTYWKGAWMDDAALTLLDIRFRDHINLIGRTTTLDEFLDDFYVMRIAQWKAFFDGVRTKLPFGAWQNFHTVAYKADPNPSKPVPPQYIPTMGPLGEQDRYDASSSEYYVRPATSDFTSRDQYDRLMVKLQWRDFRRKRDPARAWTELSLAIGPKETYKAFEAGLHKFITPELYRAYLTWTMWTCHDGGPAIFRYWDNYNVLPEALFFPTELHPKLDELGLGGFKETTVYDMERGLFDAVDEINSHATLKNFWRNGKKLVWAPKTFVVEAWPVAIQLGTEVLVYVWSPVENPPVVVLDLDFDGDGTTVPVTISGPGYWLANAAGVVEVK